MGCQLAGSWVNSWLNIGHDRAFERAGMPFSVLPWVHRGGHLSWQHGNDSMAIRTSRGSGLEIGGQLKRNGSEEAAVCLPGATRVRCLMPPTREHRLELELNITVPVTVSCQSGEYRWYSSSFEVHSRLVPYPPLPPILALLLQFHLQFPPEPM